MTSKEFDDVINLILAISDIVTALAKNAKKIKSIVQKKTKKINTS